MLCVVYLPKAVEAWERSEEICECTALAGAKEELSGSPDTLHCACLEVTQGHTEKVVAVEATDNTGLGVVIEARPGILKAESSPSRPNDNTCRDSWGISSNVMSWSLHAPLILENSSRTEVLVRFICR